MPLDAAGDAVRVTQAEGEADVSAFLDLPYRLYADDPNWRPPLRFDRRAHLKRHMEGKEPTERLALFLARRDGEVVGRVAAFLNRAHLDRYEDGAGHWGMLAAMDDDPALVGALMAAAEDHLRGLGQASSVGPFDLSVNEEIGLPVEGFETPPMLMMPFARPGLGPAVEAAGYEKAADLLAFVVGLEDHYPRPPIVRKLQAQVENDPSLTMRTMRPHRFKRDVRAAMDVFNDAWSGNWGFVPFSAEQVDHMARQLRPLLDPDSFWIGEKDGEPVAFVVMVPDVNEAARDLGGKLAPLGWTKLFWRLRAHRVEGARMMLMGTRRDTQKSRAGVALVCSLFEEAFAAGRRKGIKRCEMSWVLEGNRDVQRLIALSGAERYKTYRMYRKAL